MAEAVDVFFASDMIFGKLGNSENLESIARPVIAPAGFEDFFYEFADMTDAGPPDPAEICRLALAR